MSSYNQIRPAGVTPLSEADCAALIIRIRDGDQAAKEEFNRLFSSGIRFLLCRSIQSADVERGLQDTLSTAVRAIEAGEVREPGQLVRCILATLKRQRSTLSEQDTRAQRTGTVEDCQSAGSVLAKQLSEELLQKISATERDVMKRYYIYGENPKLIASNLDLPLVAVQLTIKALKTRLRSLKRAAGAS